MVTNNFPDSNGSGTLRVPSVGGTRSVPDTFISRQFLRAVKSPFAPRKATVLLAPIRTNSSNTLMIAEMTMQGGPSAVNCSNYRGVFSFHTAGAGAAFADGAVHLLSREISPVVFFALVTARAGEVVPGAAGGF
jgi:hypothetical protein